MPRVPFELDKDLEPTSDGDAYLDAIRDELKHGRRQWRRGDKVLEAFGYRRRRRTAIELINRRLKAKGLHTIPAITASMPLDRGITFYLKDGKKAPRTKAVEEGSQESASELEEPPVSDERSLVVGNLECAERTPEQISPSATVKKAMTTMALRDYSQLVVTTGSRQIKGIISYRSIAEAYLHGQPKIVQECLDTTVPIVEQSEPLLDVVNRFNQHTAVLVIRSDKTLAGIVTPADIAAEFGALAAPFLLIGQIEDQLRYLLHKNHPNLTDALTSVAGSTDGPPAVVSDLTMGELHRVLSNEDHWKHTGIKFDRAEFCNELDAVREVRNAVMHFRDPPEGSVERLKRFASVVQKAYLAAK